MPALDLNAWGSVRLESRSETLDFPAIATIMQVDTVSITVRGLTADEINKAQAARTNAKLAHELAESLTRAKSADAAGKLKALMGYGDNVEAVTAVEMEMVALAVTEPEEMDLPAVVKLAESFPVEFKGLVEAVNRLTGLGKQAAGSNEFGQTPVAKIA